MQTLFAAKRQMCSVVQNVSYLQNGWQLFWLSKKQSGLFRVCLYFCVVVELLLLCNHNMYWKSPLDFLAGLGVDILFCPTANIVFILQFVCKKEKTKKGERECYALNVGAMSREVCVCVCLQTHILSDSIPKSYDFV